MNPSDSRSRPLRFRFLIRGGRWSPHLLERVSSTGQSIFENMPTLLPRESMGATSVVPAPIQRPSPSVHRVGFSTSFTRLLIGSLALRPALLLLGNSRPRVATTPLPHATEAHGQLLGRDFNPLDSLLLLRTGRPPFPPLSSQTPASCRRFSFFSPSGGRETGSDAVFIFVLPQKPASQQRLHVSPPVRDQVDVDTLFDDAVDHSVGFKESLAIVADA